MNRHIPLSGAENFRDLGGYTASGGVVVWRRVFRADRLTNLTAGDAAVLSGMSLKTVIDLRTPAESLRNGPGILAGQATMLSHSLITSGITLRPTLDYGAWVEHARTPIAAVFSVMAGVKDPFPLVFHCSAGKDRTGIIAALLLSVLGVSTDDIVADYALTREYFTPTRSPDAERLHKWHGRMKRIFPDISQRVATRLLDAAPATMQALLTTLTTRYGSPVGYLDAIGIGETERAVIRGRLLA
ncbi:MAG: protein-tyrosine phosphatase [Myxococcota bacterium]|jgi:protein-tyrosine phosphatase